MCRPIETAPLGGFPMMNPQAMFQAAMNKDMARYAMAPSPAMMSYQKPQQYEVVTDSMMYPGPGYGYDAQPVMSFYPSQTMNYAPVQAPTSASVSPRDPNVDIGTFQDLLDVALEDDIEDASFDVNEGFDNSEMSILMSFLNEHDAAAESQPPATIEDVDGGVLTLNLLDDGPLEALLSSSFDDDSDDFLSDVKLTPPTGFVALNQQSMDHSTEDEDCLSGKNRRLCKMEGCQKRSRSHGLCIAHGGGRRCAVDGCNKSSQGGNLCIKHGGGKRCEVDGCERAAQSNMLCKAHGGGPRCLFEGCDKGTQRGDFCALHGGSRLCGVAGCMRNDRGGGFCATHGGGKRCAEPGCMKPCRRQGLCSAHFRVHSE
ncbi:hypothetical protein SPRG_00405 [Saprolegnia parasitica CBS 223.65]|uniref:C2H2-type domain-containing protein n=1 Tax=Saprolegnia parasitica (strain CBS 223.65) TaxID=695850 RepID=A0A067D237_SAPPC|nr:hypothetical protein SPRG_00405 [Saprolegnia parasitica CBS 223.65]KDO35560.1 hypothetical protein SPRG_00405 [Saprolegnia parasitica CBS 223.65]|eukprot:XP_012193894.1 hypothetical protein SPRG_00405 [Saprolegnia parasitica CBS 223.65]